MRMWLSKLQDNNKEAQKLRSDGLLEGLEVIEEVLHYQGLPYVPKVISLELINRHHNDFLENYIGIKKT